MFAFTISRYCLSYLLHMVLAPDDVPLAVSLGAWRYVCHASPSGRPGPSVPVSRRVF